MPTLPSPSRALGPPGVEGCAPGGVLEPWTPAALVFPFPARTSLRTIPASPDPSGPFLRSGNRVLSSSRPHPGQRRHARVGRGSGGGRGCLSALGILPSAPTPTPSPQVSVVEVSVPPPGFLQQPLPGLFHRPLAWCTRMGGPQRPLLAPPKPGSPSTLSPTVALPFWRARRWRGSQRLLCGRLQSSLQTKAYPHLQGGVLRAYQTTAVRALSSRLVPCRPLSVPETPNPLGCRS